MRTQTILLAIVITLILLPRIVGIITRLLQRASDPLRGPVERRAGTATAEDAPVQQVTVAVPLEGGPLKEGHRRRVIRDARLAAKRRPPRHLLSGKRVRVFSTEQANRLFSMTMRTSNRAIRDLAADEAQLQRMGLPLWRTEEDLALALEIPVRTLRFFSLHRASERYPHYVAFRIPKRSGGTRLIMAPRKRLKAILRRLKLVLVDHLAVHDAAHGFRAGRSVRTNADPHVGKPVVLKLDIKEFFPSITFHRVRGYLIAMGYSYPVAQTLAVLMTECERQPVQLDGAIVHVPVGTRHCVQGAPTSPGICNAIVHRMDRRLAGLARRNGFVYTRYADDLTFSGDDASRCTLLIKGIGTIAEAEGFHLNVEKTRILRRGGCQRVTGVVVNEVAGLSRKERRLLRARLHHLETGRASDPSAESASLEGKLAYLQMLNAGQAEKLRRGIRPPNVT